MNRATRRLRGLFLLACLLSALQAHAGTAANNPPSSGGGGAVSSVAGTGVVSCSPTTGAVVCSAPTVQSSSAVAITGGTIANVAITNSTIVVPTGTAGSPSIRDTNNTGTYFNAGQVLWSISGSLFAYVDSVDAGFIGYNLNTNADGSGYLLGSGGIIGMRKDGAATAAGIRFETTDSGATVGVARLKLALGTGNVQTLNSAFTSFTSASATRDQANGEVMAFGATPPTQASGAAVALNAYKFDAVTATFTGTTSITTATGVNFVALNAPTYTDASALTIADSATLYISGAPVAGGSVTLTRKYSIWVDSGLVRLDGSITGAGGGAAATLGTIGGSGPTTAAQARWLPVSIDGTASWLAVWQ